MRTDLGSLTSTDIEENLLFVQIRPRDLQYWTAIKLICLYHANQKLRQTLASFLLIILEYTSSESSTSLGILEDALYPPAGSGETNTRAYHTRMLQDLRIFISYDVFRVFKLEIFSAPPTEKFYLQSTNPTNLYKYI